MKPQHYEPWSNPSSYEPEEIEAEQPLYLWRGGRLFLLLVLLSLALTVFLGYLALR